MAQTPQQKAYWDSIPDNTKLTPEMALASGFTQDAQGRWITPEGSRYWTGGLGTKGGVLKQVLKDTGKVAAIGAGLGLAAGALGGGAAASSAASPSLGAAGTPSELAALGGNAGAVTGGAAPALTGLGAGAAGGGGWASWLPKLATVGAQVYGGLNTRSALKQAQEQQQAGTQAAMQIQNQALNRAGDIYNQQRADTQNLFGQPYQTLGGLIGLNIAPIGPANGRIPTSAQPTGVPTGLNPNVPLTEPYPGAPAAAEPLVGLPIDALATPQAGMTLKELAALGSRRKSQTSYGSGAAKERA